MEILGIVLALVGIVLGVAALAVGIIHVREIKVVLKGTKEQLKGLESLQQSTKTQLERLESLQQSTKVQLSELDTIQAAISTRYLSEFPNFIPDIVNLIRGARADVRIFCDIPAYGQFTARTDWIQYSHAIEDLKENVSINLTCLNPERRISAYREQFLQKLHWEEWRDSLDNRGKLKALLKANKSELGVDSLTEETFVKFLEDTNKLMLRGAFARAELREIEFFMPIYFWLVDGTKAIFSVPAFSGGHTEYGFFTTDQKFIAALADMRERYIRRPPTHSNIISGPTPDAGGEAGNR
jgi:hypothetical protein